MTEEEAKTKWCPFVRALGMQKEAVEAVNTILIGDDLVPDRTKALCIASACMAWRGTGGNVEHVDKEAITSWTNAGWMLRSISEAGIAEIYLPIHGYCGLAGKP